MKIQRVSNDSQKFQSNINKFGEDDLISQARRNYLREHLSQNTLPFYDILGQEKRLEEYELKKLIASLCGQKVNQDSQLSIFKKIYQIPTNPQNTTQKLKGKLNNEAIENLPLFNLELVSNKLGVYRGQTLNGNLNALKVLKQAGIERIVDLAGYEGLKETCKDMGLEYLYYSTPPYYFLQGQMFKTEEGCKEQALHQCKYFRITDKSAETYVNRNLEHWRKNLKIELDDFVKFIQTMKKGKLYIGCEYGTYTTDNALMLNAFFNPLYVREKKFVTTYNRPFTSKLINLYKNLTTEHKRLLGWIKEFDQLTLKRLQAMAL